MRVVVDLQACQTEASAGRGVGRYSFELARGLGLAGSNHDFRFVLNGGFHESAAALRKELSFSIRANSFSTYSYPDPTEVTGESREFRRHAGEAIVSSNWMRLQPDILHVSHVFEGFSSRAVVPETPKCPGVISSATLFDLIPLRFPELYLVDPGFKKWYLRQLGMLRQFDLLLAISESTRQDAIDLLGLAPHRVATIWGGVGPQFREVQLSVQARETVLKRCGIASRFVLYTGGDDHRKNIKGLIRGFAALPAAIRTSVQLAIVCSIHDSRRATYLDFARDCGLHSGEVLFTGFVSEQDLVSLYNLCEVFVFPSLYEGFGLPVLEAMACGAPVLGANNSSIREILDCPAALFDPSSADSIANSIERVLCDSELASRLRQFGRSRVETYSWSEVATRALKAFEEVFARSVNVRGDRHQAANLERKRLAVFTPLPPCRSGIADYNAAFLPYLKQYFDIDLFIDDYEPSAEFLLANFSIRNHREFDRLYLSYDAVLYEMGNSEFHAYMLDYLERYPGVVGLHDAYLSGLLGYLEYQGGQNGRYLADMLASHTTRARRFFAPAMKCDDPVFRSMVDLPATKKVLDNAIGVIAHSPFNREVSEQNYPEGWAAPFRVINQMVLPRPRLSDGLRSEVRRRLGFKGGEFVVATFGHVAWTKLGDILLAAFEMCSSRTSRVLRLVYAGELAGDEFGQRLEKAVRSCPFADRVSITGYLGEAHYADYLSAADLGVQLRKNSRGGTPKGVLDCLASGLPVIVNNEASYMDYPDWAVCKVAAQPGCEDVSLAIEQFLSNEQMRVQVSERGRRFVAEEHRPDRVASQYAVALNEFQRRSWSGSAYGLVSEIARAVEPGSVNESELVALARVIQREETQSPFSKQRILVDVSHIVGVDHGTGIPRVVRNLVRELSCSKVAGVEFVFVSLNENQGLGIAKSWLLSQGVAIEEQTEQQTSDMDEIVLHPSDTLLMLDSSWGSFDRFEGVFNQLSHCGGRIITVIYDLLPIRLPQFIVPGGSEWFRGWLEKAVDVSDGLICISRAVADEVIQFLRERNGPRSRPIRIGWWHLGGDFSIQIPDDPENAIQDVFSRSTLLMVGTIEPRKGHGLALDAMERLWAQGLTLRLCVVGRRGWLDEELISRMKCHPHAGELLFFFEGLPDDQLNFCYREATGLLFPSFGEGFGLPLIEAARFGTPIMASDLAVFREIAGEHATYVRTDSADSLAADISDWHKSCQNGILPDSRRIKWKTWEESADQLCDVLLGNNWYATLNGDSG